MKKDILRLRQQVKKAKPLIHCITNPISIHDCANVILALGGKPIMAEHPKEAASITEQAEALLLNLGNITDARMESMKLSLLTAKSKNIPVMLDLVGTACSRLRLDFAKHLISLGGISILKGNISELLALAGQPSHSIGIDAGEKDKLTSENLKHTISILKKLAGETDAVILASGEKDLVVDKCCAYLCSNGVPLLSRITGTGCMLGALCTAYLTAGTPMEAALLGVAVMGVAGELAASGCQTPGIFQYALLDQIYTMEDSVLEKKSQIRQARLDMTLYLVTDSTYHTEASFLHTIEEACKGGITLLQLREKNVGGNEYLNLARKVKKITDQYQIPMIIDDRLDVALACGAAGVHLGNSDLPVKEARKLLGTGKIVGATAKTVAAAKEAYENGADYLGVGAIYPTTTKVITKLTEVATLISICQEVPIPVIAIGGLSSTNLQVLAEAPIDGIAVVSSIMKAGDPQKAAKQLKEAVTKLLKSH